MILSPGQIYRLANRHVETIDPMLITAICLQESGGNPLAVRYEPDYRWIDLDRRRPASCTGDTERVLQSMSWGLMQIMGATARSCGFDRWLTELLDPEVNMYWACYHIERLAGRYTAESDLIAAYNAGSVRRKPSGELVNQQYVDAVLERLTDLRRAD